MYSSGVAELGGSNKDLKFCLKIAIVVVRGNVVVGEVPVLAIRT